MINYGEVPICSSRVVWVWGTAPYTSFARICRERAHVAAQVWSPARKTRLSPNQRPPLRRVCLWPLLTRCNFVEPISTSFTRSPRARDVDRRRAARAALGNIVAVAKSAWQLHRGLRTAAVVVTTHLVGHGPSDIAACASRAGWRSENTSESLVCCRGTSAGPGCVRESKGFCAA